MAGNSEQQILTLEDLGQADGKALDQYFPIIYNELKQLASSYLSAEYRQVTLRTTDLVHEAYMKLAGGATLTWENKAHFFGLAARSMRQILVDLARKRKSLKRGGDHVKVSLSDGFVIMDETSDKLMALDEALEKLAGFDERLSNIVELRYFSGMTIDEAAVVLDLSPATVKREWKVAKAWLYRELEAGS